jgi:hypothetical protein
MRMGKAPVRFFDVASSTLKEAREYKSHSLELLQTSSVDVSISVRPPRNLGPRNWASNNQALAIPSLFLHHALSTDFQD